jgi:subtilisin family serine protease
MKKSTVFIGACAVMLNSGFAHAAPDVYPSSADALEKGKLALQEDPTLKWIPNQILVRFKSNDEPLNHAARTLVSGRLIRTFTGLDRLEHIETGMPIERAINMLNALPFVEYAEPNYVVRVDAQPNDQFVGLQWGVNNTGQDIRGVLGTSDADIDGFEAWDTRTSAAGVVVAVIDTGIQWDHPDLDGNIWSNTDEIAGNGIDDDNNGYVDDIRGWDFFSNDNNPTDTEGHGTHVAGTIGAEGNNGIGVAGVAWDVQLMPLRFLGPNGGSTSDAIAALNYAVANGARISNNSWGGGGFSTAMRDAIANARNQNHLFVAASGNDGVNTDNSPHYPSSYSENNIISVAATDNRDGIASFSNFGVSTVDIGAPGVDIASTYNGNGYVWNSGTSMASPHVAGAAAVLLAHNPSWTYAQLRDRLFSTARPTNSMNNTTAIGGVLNLQAALAGGGGPANTAPSATIGSPSNGSTFSEGNSVNFSGNASDSEDGNISASLIWTSNLDGQIGAGASFAISSLSVGTHTITASVSDSGGMSDSDSVNVTIESDEPPSSPPATPGRPLLSNLGGGSVGISWADNSNNETSFEVRRQQRVGRSWTNTTTVASVGADVTSTVDTVSNGRWRYRVRAVNASGASSWSSWRTIRVR